MGEARKQYSAYYVRRFCQSLLGVFILLYVAAVFISIYGILNPYECQFKNENKNSRNFQQSCIRPMISQNSFVDIRLYAGQRPSKHNYVPSSSILIWSILNHSIMESFDATVNFSIPSFVRLKNEVLYGQIALNEANSYGDPLKIGSHMDWNVQVVPLSLTVLRKSSNRNNLKNLLANTSTSQVDNKIDMAITSPPDNRIRNRQHWKYKIHPLIIRYVNLQDRVFEHEYLTHLSEYLDIRRIPPTLARVYAPIVWIDETAMVQSHFIEISDNISAPNITLKIQFRPMSSLYYAYKKMILMILKNALK